MSTAARPIFTPAPPLVSAETTHNLVTDELRLIRDNKSLRVRCETLIRALNDSVTVSAPICKRTGMALIADLIKAAQISEALGEVAVIRFTRREGTVVGVEVALLEREESTQVPAATAPVQFGGMAVAGVD